MAAKRTALVAEELAGERGKRAADDAQAGKRAKLADAADDPDGNAPCSGGM
jgi:hypothetical protein